MPARYLLTCLLVIHLATAIADSGTDPMSLAERSFTGQFTLESGLAVDSCMEFGVYDPERDTGVFQFDVQVPEPAGTIVYAGVYQQVAVGPVIVWGGSVVGPEPEFELGFVFGYATPTNQPAVAIADLQDAEGIAIGNAVYRRGRCTRSLETGAAADW